MAGFTNRNLINGKHMQAILMSSYVILAGDISANSNDMVEWMAGFSQGHEVSK